MRKLMTVVIWPESGWSLEQLHGHEIHALTGGYCLESAQARGADGRFIWGAGGTSYYFDRLRHERPYNPRAFAYMQRRSSLIPALSISIAGPVVVLGDDYGQWVDVEEWVVADLLFERRWSTTRDGALFDGEHRLVQEGPDDVWAYLSIRGAETMACHPDRAAAYLLHKMKEDT